MSAGDVIHYTCDLFPFERRRIPRGRPIISNDRHLAIRSPAGLSFVIIIIIIVAVVVVVDPVRFHRSIPSPVTSSDSSLSRFLFAVAGIESDRYHYPGSSVYAPRISQFGSTPFFDVNAISRPKRKPNRGTASPPLRRSRHLATKNATNRPASLS